MSDMFSVSDIVEFGVEIEKNGKDFYEILAEKSTNYKHCCKTSADTPGIGI